MKNICKNQMNLTAKNIGASFVCPIGSSNGREDGFYKYYQNIFNNRL